MWNLPRSVLNFAQENLGLRHKRTVHLEGGLGSQILGAIYFWNLLDTMPEGKVGCNLSYFKNSTVGILLRPWALDSFGIPITEFQKYEKLSRYSSLLSKKDYLTEQEIEANYWETARTKYLDRFSFSQDYLIGYFNSRLNLDLHNDYTAVHIRRGDYLQVASLLISVENYADLLNSIEPLLSKEIVFVSDSPLHEQEIVMLTEAVGPDRKSHFLDSPDIDPFAAHCLLRNSTILVCANSTFSFTAGLLGKIGQSVFSPLNFHAGRGSQKYNNTLRLPSSFTLWPRRN